MNNLTAQQLRNFLNEIEADGNDLSTIEINFREHEDSDIAPIGYVFEDLHDDLNDSIKSIVFQSKKLHNVQTNYMGFTTGAYNYVDELNELIGRKAFSCRTIKADPNPYTNWIIFGYDITTDEIERLNLSEDFIIN
jgi:hypothetical protein